MILPSGWTETSSKSSEVQIIQMTAPTSYGFVPSTFTVNSYIGIVDSTVTARGIAQQVEQHDSSADSAFSGGQITDCNVLSDTAAFFPFATASTTGIHLFLIHNQLAYDAIVVGKGGLGSQFVIDAKGILGSWTWRA